ncbi:MAG TPA: secretin N-terminal domain-containing protein [Albitalea sp.]
MIKNTLHSGACLLLFAALAGCAAPPAASSKLPPAATLDRIKDEVRAAAQREPAKPLPTPDAVERALLPPLAADIARPPAPPEPRFDLTVSNAPAQQVFLQIVSGTKYSMLVPPEVSGTIAINLKNVTVREALDSLRDLYGYEYRMQGNRIFIQPNTLQTRIFQVNYLAGKRRGTTDMRVTSGSISSNPAAGSTGAAAAPPSGQGNGASVQSSRISTENDNDFWGELRETLGAIVGTDANRKVIVNPLSGVIAVRGFPHDIRNAENYLRMTQLIIERQVMIEAKIIEVQLSDSFASGVNWSAFRSRNGRLSGGQLAPGTVLAPTGTISTGTASSAAGELLAEAGQDIATAATNPGSIFGLAFQAHNFAALLQFLETQGNVQVLSSPRIATINNQKAVLKVGTDEFFVTSVTTNTTQGTGGTTNSPTIGVQPFFSGIALDVTPQIDENDSIILHLHPSVSVVAEKQKNVNLGSLGNFQLPLASSTVNESDSVVRVTDGNIVAIGGLMKQQQSGSHSGLPGAVDQPVVGSLFGQKSRAGSKSELVILLKPTIIRGERGWQSDLADVQQRLDGYAPPAATTAR